MLQPFEKPDARTLNTKKSNVSGNATTYSEFEKGIYFASMGSHSRNSKTCSIDKVVSAHAVALTTRGLGTVGKSITTTAPVQFEESSARTATPESVVSVTPSKAS